MNETLKNLICDTLSEDILSYDEQTVNYYLQGTEGLELFKEKKRSILGVLKLSKSAQIKAILDLTNKVAQDPELRFSLYPISTGKNWGYGTCQPASTDSNIMLLDLSQMDKIIDFDEELGLVTLEPGVSQQKLSDFLQSNNYDYMVPVTGAGPDCSVLANALERGYGITPYTEHFTAVNAIQGFWADGQAFQSAIYHLDKTDEKLADKSFKWGVGPYLDGLFTQSSYGIVSQMTIRLAKRKAAFTSFFVQIKDDSLLEQATPLIRQVLQNYEGIVGSINLMDKRRVLSMFATNPAGYSSHQVMTANEVDAIAKKLQTPGWTIVGTIYGSKAVVKAVKKEINQIFKQIPSMRIYSNSPLIAIANKVIFSLPDFLTKNIPLLTMAKEQLTSFNLGEEIMLGKPNRVALKLAYWRNPNAESIDINNMQPDKDKCGLLWYAPLIPMKAEAMRRYVDFIREVCPKHNIEPFITFTNLRHDCVDSTIPIVFNLSNPQAVSDAHNCLRELVEKGLEKGYIPYRLNIDQQQWLLDKDNNYWRKVNEFKHTVDPNNILSPNRYNPT